MRSPARRPSVVFRVAAGPRLGFGHLVRAAALARAMRVPFALSLRGGAGARAVARNLGAALIDDRASDVLATGRLRLLVIDDPSFPQASRWRRAAAVAGVAAASVTDLGLAWCDADLTIDGSIVHPFGRRRGDALLGPRFAILAGRASTWREPRRASVLIALGGGPRVRAARRLAAAIRRARPDVEVRVAAGLAPAARRPRTSRDGIVLLGARPGLTADLARATVAVVGGGVSAYDACRTGTPAVASAVVAAQRPTIRGLARCGVIVDGGSLARPDTTAARTVRLLGDAGRRARLTRAARTLVDGRGAARVARALHALARNYGAGQ